MCQHPRCPYRGHSRGTPQRSLPKAKPVRSPTGPSTEGHRGTDRDSAPPQDEGFPQYPSTPCFSFFSPSNHASSSPPRACLLRGAHLQRRLDCPVDDRVGRWVAGPSRIWDAALATGRRRGRRHAVSDRLTASSPTQTPTTCAPTPAFASPPTRRRTGEKDAGLYWAK